MRSLLGLIFIIVVFLPIFSTIGSNNQSKLTIYVGGYDNPPKVYPNGDNNYVGIFPDLLNYIAGKENWELHWVTCEWSVCLQKLQTNQINTMIDVAYDD